jgi:hypothetical protein
MPDGEVVSPNNAKTGQRRSIYLQVRRTQPVTLMDTFDAPFMNPNCVKRAQSVVSSQALELMNSDLVRQASRYVAGRVIDQSGDDPTAQIEQVYWLVLSRKPSADELSTAKTALQSIEQEWLKQLKSDGPEEPVKPRAHWLALATLCHTALNSAEFIYVD